MILTLDKFSIETESDKVLSRNKCSTSHGSTVTELPYEEERQGGSLQVHRDTGLVYRTGPPPPVYRTGPPPPVYRTGPPPPVYRRGPGLQERAHRARSAPPWPLGVSGTATGGEWSS